MKDQRIAVVGAGAAGLTAAQELKKRGYQHTTVFEKEEAVGGKVSTYFLDGKPYELGAIWATTDYRTVHALSDELAVPRFAAQPLAMMTAQGKITDLLTFILKEYGFSSLARDSLHFWTLGLRHSRIKKPGFSGYPPDFFLSLDELARKYRFGALAYAMAPTMSACGYGYYEQAPALYWMKLMVLLFTFALRSGGLRGQLRSFDNGFQSLWQEVAKGLDVRTGSPVTSMKRSARGTAAAKIELTVNGGTHVFDKIIVTVPLETAHEFMDLSVMERTLFGKIRTLQYVVTVVDADSEAHVAFTRNIKRSIPCARICWKSAFASKKCICKRFGAISPMWLGRISKTAITTSSSPCRAIEARITPAAS
ncbi:MAG: FAD-dependent oxidoreductase [Myxococcota bacterium]|nr:FAD-dependent oxidoreductase [Myxococcota bacterium]